MTPEGRVEILPRTNGIALGVMDEVEFEEGQAMLVPGDLLYLFTDGMSDAENENKEFYEEARLMNFLGGLKQATPDMVVNSVHEEITEFIGNGDQFDDMTQLAIQYLSS